MFPDPETVRGWGVAYQGVGHALVHINALARGSFDPVYTMRSSSIVKHGDFWEKKMPKNATSIYLRKGRGQS
jgi:hypothetical protein